MMNSTAWEGQDQHMASAPDLEFNQFFEMSSLENMADTTSMQFDFHGFQDATPQSIMAPATTHPHQPHPQQQQQQQRQRQGQQHGQASAPGTLMANSDPSSMMPHSNGLLHNNTPVSGHMLATPAPDSISSIDAQIQYLQQQKIQQQQRLIQEQQATFFVNHGHSVPPTPQSLDMLPTSGHLYSQPEQIPHRASYDHSYHQRVAEQQDMAFTPLISPAVTPLDPHFNIDHAFSVSGSYLSPLTSPALHAQPDSASVYGHSSNSNNSPTDMDLDTLPATQPVQPAQDLAKKARKNSATKARSKSGIKSSPIAKPQRRKTGPSPAMVSQVLSEVEEGGQQNGAGLLSLSLFSPATGPEENASVSPENLSEMPPPPVPASKSNSKSPYIQAQNGKGAANQAPVLPLADQQQQPHPATPASLMKLPSSKDGKPQTSQQSDTATDNIESLVLPESVSNRPLAPIDTQIASKFSQGTDQSPSATRGSALHSSPSPSLTPVTSNMPISHSPSLGPRLTGSAARKTPKILPRNSKKGSAANSIPISPALLPKISPNIKPLISGTMGMSAEDTSRLLMSKSNYQNILEGNMVPGVSYPSELSTNLTSKRTSHKIAEQGRRNRINSALQIMAGLLPEPPRPAGADGEEKEEKKEDKKASTNNNTANSKASVVENAIVHMKKLQEENGDLKKQLEELKSRMEKMKRGEGVK